MKILAMVPIEKVPTGPSTFSFLSKLREVEVIRIIRHKVDGTRNRYAYSAEVHPPIGTPTEAVFQEGDGPGVCLVNINRNLNPTWEPPEFPAQEKRVAIAAPGADAVAVARATAFSDSLGSGPGAKAEAERPRMPDSPQLPAQQVAP